MNSKTQKISNINQEKESFLNINQQTFTELLTFIDFADERLNIGFVEIKFSQDRDILIDALLEHPDCNNIQFEILDFSDPSLRFLRDELVTALKQINIQQNKKLILLITGLEKSIGIVEEYPSVLTNLNFVRDDLRTSIPHPILLFLPDYALTRLAKYAPDFWAWRRKVFTFKTNRKNLITNSRNIIFSNNTINNLDSQKKQARIEQLLNLLNEYNTSPDEKTKNDLLIIGNIYNQLGNTYQPLGQYQKAIIFHQQASEISRKIGERGREAISLSNLGIAYHALGQYQQAIIYYQQALEIYREIGNRQSEGNALGNLGTAYDSLGKHKKAITYYQQALEIYRDIGNKQGEGNTLSNLGTAYDSLGEYQKAITYYKQHLNISREIGDKEGEGMSLCGLGNTYNFLRQHEEAINYHQEALNIFKRTGNKLEEAITNFNLGLSFKDIQRHDDAMEAFRNARKLYQDMGLDKCVENCDDAINILENHV
ncbi:tetratricopeptide repeat protein [Crocosphaera sp.]|uniref:tetratricopeptide repeat protein n=1 Tax=Crocosphaera sp. TaxID=2729996 RepID=UPI002627C9D1|nr:tetratricopeptide repeat protein [Crocosphaera sp.]MDJ0580326.1 tetratricopeptide repeat protein [Crocosphaera sp.]